MEWYEQPVNKITFDHHELPEFPTGFDVDKVETSLEVINFLTTKCEEAAYYNRLGAYEECFAIYQEIDTDFEDICDKYLETGGNSEMELEPFKSVFELLGLQIDMKEDQTGIDVLLNSNLSTIKYLICDVVDMKCGILLKSVIDGIMHAFAFAGFPEVAKLFLVVARNSVIMMDMDEILEDGESSCLLIETELNFMERVLINSVHVIKNGSSWKKSLIEKVEFEMEVYNMLEVLGIADYYVNLPAIIKNYYSAKQFTDIMLTKITKYESLSERFQRNLQFRAKSSYWRGLIFNHLAELQEDTKLKNDTIGKSRMYWNRLLSEYFTKWQFIAYEKAPKKHSNDLRMYLIVLQFNTTGIDDIVARIMRIESKCDPILGQLLKELNVLRLNYIREFDILLKLVHIFEELPQWNNHFVSRIIDICMQIAKQYRSLVVTDYCELRKKKNIKESVQYLKMAAALEDDPIDGEELTAFVNEQADLIDAEEFNVKYCL